MQSLTFLIAVSAALAAFTGPAEESLASRPLFRFEDAASVESWRPNHDGVMGGVSTGQASWRSDGWVRFAGKLSLEKGGGFASFRKQMSEPLDLSESCGLKLRVRGDGRNWKVSLRTEDGQGDPNWQAPFRTSQGDEWQIVMIPFDVFVPVFHGRYARTAKPLNLTNLTSIGLLVADGQAGEYSLELSSIDAWEIGPEPALPGTLSARHARTEALAAALDQDPSAKTLLELLEYSERVLVVAEPLTGDDYGKSASLQRGTFVSVMEDLADRELRIVHLAGDRASLVAGRQLGVEATKALRKHWGLPLSDWSCLLIGKDGGIKRRWSEPIEPQEVFELIDVMPMRRSEVRRRGEDPESDER